MPASLVRFGLIGIFALCAMVAAADGTIYRWVDDGGETHLVSDMSQVPPQHREAALEDAKKRSGGTVNIIEGLDDEPHPAKVETPNSDEPAATAGEPAPAGDPEIVEGGEGGYYGDERLRRERARHLRNEAKENGAGPGEEPARPPHAGPGEHRSPQHSPRGHR
jgi:hypothetical protein